MSSLVKWSGKSFGAWLFIAALCPARGELDILDGKYAGLSTPSPPFAISPALFDVTAQLVATNATQWSYVSCPPKYVGSEQLEGKLVLIRNQKLTCSRKELGVTLIELGAIGSISLGQRSGLLPVMAGKNYYSHAPDETLEPLSLPQTHAVGELVYKLFEDVRVGAIVRARMTPSRNVWLDMWASPYWVLWQAILTIQSAVVLELGVMRLYAYVREDKGPRLSIPQVILFIDSISHMERLAFVAIDPYRSRGIYSDRTVAWMFMNHQSSLARALFIIYFAQAGALSGIATPFIAQPLWAALLLGTCMTSLLVIIVISSFALQHWLLVTAKVVIGTFMKPIVELVLAVLTYYQVKRKLTTLPVSLLNKVESVVRITCYLGVVQLLFGIPIHFAVDNPISLYVMTFGFRSAQNAISYVQVKVFKPLSVPVPRGPIGSLVDLLLGALQFGTRRKGIGLHSTRCPLQAHSQKSLAPRLASLGSQVVPVPSDAQPAAEDPLVWRHLGISLRFARECILAFDLDADHTVAHLGKRMHVSFASLPGAGARPAVELYKEARTLDGFPAVGEATMFVLHSPDVAFADLVASLGSYSQHHNLDPQRTFFWLAAFARHRLPLNERQLRIIRPAGAHPRLSAHWDRNTSFQLQLIQKTPHVASFDARLRTALNEHERAISGAPAEPLPPCLLHSSAMSAVPHSLETDNHSIMPIPALVALFDDESRPAALEDKQETSYYLLRYMSPPTTTCSFFKDKEAPFKIAA